MPCYSTGIVKFSEFFVLVYFVKFTTEDYFVKSTLIPNGSVLHNHKSTFLIETTVLAFLCNLNRT